MPNLSDLVVDIFKVCNVTAAEVSRKSGVSQARISEIVSGKTTDPRWKTMVKIAGALNVSISAFAGESIVVSEPNHVYSPEPLPPEEQDLLRRFRKLDERHQQNILEMIAGYEVLSEGGTGTKTAVGGSAALSSGKR